MASLAIFHPTFTAAIYEPIRAAKNRYCSKYIVVYIFLIPLQARTRRGEDQPALSNRTFAKLEGEEKKSDNSIGQNIYLYLL